MRRILFCATAIKYASPCSLVVAVLMMATFPSLSVAAGPVAASAPLASPELTALRTEQDRLAALRTSPNVSPDRWADAQIFIKAVTWALDFGPLADDATRASVKKGLNRARERIDALAADKHPWTERRGRSVRGFVSAIDGSVQPYGLVIPNGYDPAKPMRLDVVLHGSRNATGIGELQFIDANDAPDIGAAAPSNPFIELDPMGRLGENAYRFEGETDLDEAIEAVCRNYNIDRTRIVLRGQSLGGVGTWQLGLKRPDRFVAIGPTSGPVDTYEFASSPWKHFVRLDPLTPWQKTMLHLVDAIDYTANAGMVPVIAVMGDKDPYFSSHLLIEKAFAKEGIPFTGIVDHGAGHAVTPAAMQQQLHQLGEFAERGTDPLPKHIRFVTWTLKFSRCHWIEVLGLTAHYQRAEIEARIDSNNSISVTEPKNITRFAIYPPALSDKGGVVTIDGSRITVPASNGGKDRPIVFEKQSGAWICRGALDVTSLSGKHPGLQGPIDDAFARPFLCVRGTGKAWHPAVASWADANLNRFADEWRRHYHGYLPAKNDTEVTEDDIRHSNLILFGDPGSNLWISKVLPDLPIRWTRDTLAVGAETFSPSDHGVQLIHPNPLPGAGHHYVVLNSGHTYHDAELRFSYMVFPRLGDWAVMKVNGKSAGETSISVEESVVDSGFFDEEWGTPMLR